MKKHHNSKKRSFGRRLCILLMAAFTLVMIADLANLFLTPAEDQMGFGPGGGFTMPENGGFTMPEGMEPPGGGDFPMPGDNAAGEEAAGGGNRGGRQAGLLQLARRQWLLILLVCAVGDGICLMVLLRIRRKEKAQEQDADHDAGLPAPAEEEREEESPGHRHGFWVPFLCLGAAFAVILSMLPAGEDGGSITAVHREVLSGTATAAQINTVLSGAGTLQADTLTQVTVPRQVTVLKYHVRNGETVETGDPLVSVDRISAASAMRTLNEILEELDDDLSSEKNKTQSAGIASATSGRVKQIYAREGDAVADVLYEHGALLLLSLDGYMKVTFESEEALSVGDAVEVRYSGGTEAGRIAAVRMGKVTVTLPDDTAPYGAEAAIVDENGSTIGEGKLEINSEMKVIGYYGTIRQIRVDVGDKVSAGSTLFALEKAGYTTEYQILLARRNELEEQLQKLSQLAKTGMVYAENGGIVSGVPEDADIELLSSNRNGAVTANNLSATAGGWKVVLLTNSTEEFQPAENIYYAAKVISADNSAVSVLCAATSETSASFDPAAYDNGQMTQGYQLAVTLFPHTPQADSYVIFRVSAGEDGASQITVTIPGSPEEPTPEARLNGIYAARLVTNTGGSLYLWLNPTAGDYTAVDLTTLEAQMTRFGGFPCSPAISGSDIALGDSVVKLEDLKTEDLLLLRFTDDVVTQVIKAQRPGDPSGGQMPGGAPGGLPSGGAAAMPSGGSGAGMPSGMGGAGEQTYETYIAEETGLLYISDQEEVSVNISIDELDILSVAPGMEVQVTLDAVKGQSYPGRIARIASDGTNDGGNTKYDVTILLPRAGVMLDGMNASVKIVTNTSYADVTVPAAAFVEDDGRTYVYTSYDAETDTLGGLIEVETGVSDGEKVEILSGLGAGDAYYYRYADTVTYQFLPQTP